MILWYGMLTNAEIILLDIYIFSTITVVCQMSYENRLENSEVDASLFAASIPHYINPWSTSRSTYMVSI